MSFCLEITTTYSNQLHRQFFFLWKLIVCARSSIWKIKLLILYNNSSKQALYLRKFWFWKKKKRLHFLNLTATYYLHTTNCCIAPALKISILSTNCLQKLSTKIVYKNCLQKLSTKLQFWAKYKGRKKKKLILSCDWYSYNFFMYHN